MLGWFKRKRQAPETNQEEDHGQIPTKPVQLPDTAVTGPDTEKRCLANQPESTPTELNDSHAASGDNVLTAAAGPTPETIVTGETVIDTPKKESSSIIKRLAERLSRTRESFTNRIDELFLGKKIIDAELFDELEEILVTADIGITTTQNLLEQARRQVKRDALSNPQELKEIIKKHLKDAITSHDGPSELVIQPGSPFVVMVIGVNGVGKTTTIGKIARKFLDNDQSVLLVAADTFRAAATSQLKIWGERNKIRVVSQHEGADPSAVVFDGMAVAVSKGYDVVLIDTAGRLHTKANLMEELKKIKRVIAKQLPGAPHEVLLVIDATTGQNGISQAILFNEAVGVSGIALTKLDGTAKGGIIVNISSELKLPIRFIGVGEQIDDLREFDAREYIDALFEP